VGKLVIDAEKAGEEAGKGAIRGTVGLPVDTAINT